MSTGHYGTGHHGGGGYPVGYSVDYPVGYPVGYPVDGGGGPPLLGMPEGPIRPPEKKGEKGKEKSGGGFFDPKTTAIDTTNPHALPIIEMIKQFMMQQARQPRPQQQRAPGPMSQLYPNGVPKFDPVNAGSTQIRSYQPQYMNQHTANNFNPEALLRSL